MKTLNTMNVRYVILKQLEQYVYMQVHIRMQETLEQLIARNDSFNNADVGGFWYRGEKWVSKHSYSVRGMVRLHSELHGEMDIYIEERNHIRDVEGPLVVGFLRCIMNHSKDTESMLRLVPVALQEPVMEILRSNLSEIPNLSTDEVAKIVGAPQIATEALKTRMMRNLLEE